jgi:hypothetical protein
MMNDETFAAAPPAYMMWLALAAAAVILVLHAALRFTGLQSPSTMEHAQLARSIADGKGYTTACLRPAETVRQHTRGQPAADGETRPETSLAPLYSSVLAGFLRISGTRQILAAPSTRLFRPETHAVMPMSLLALLSALLLISAIGKYNGWSEEAGLAVMLTAMTPAFLDALNDAGPVVLETALITSLWFCCIFAADNPHRLLPRALTGLCAAACLLTASATLPGVIAALLFLFWNRTDEERPFSIWLLLLCGTLPLAAWGMHLYSACGNPFGSAHYNWVDGSVFYASGIIHRSLDDIWRPHLAISGIFGKGLAGWYTELSRTPALLPWLTLTAVGIVTRRQNLREMSLSVFATAGILLSAFWNAATATELTQNHMMVWLPLAVLTGIRALWMVLDSALLLAPPFRQWIISALLLFAALPVYNGWRHAPQKFPYPPYHPAIQAAATGLLPSGGVVCTDIPWATAWYTGRTSILLPQSPEETIRLNNIIPLAGIYMTGVTQRRFIAGTGRHWWHSTWLPVWNGMSPAEWPWRHGIRIPPETHDQLVLLKDY